MPTKTPASAPEPTPTSISRTAPKTFTWRNDPSGAILALRLESPWGSWLLASQGEALIGLWPEGGYQGDLAMRILQSAEPDSPLALGQTWFHRYLQGQDPSPWELPLAPLYATDFRRYVWAELLAIPSAETRSYADIAENVAQAMGRRSMSPRAVGGAVGANPLSLMIPCQRVIASDGSLGGYAWGLEMKAKLLEHEREFYQRNAIHDIGL